MTLIRTLLCRLGFHSMYYADVQGAGALASGMYCQYCDEKRLRDAINSSIAEVRSLREFYVQRDAYEREWKRE